MKHQTVMGEAFVQAGYQPPPTLDELAVQAWGKYSGALMQGARLGFLREALKGEPLHADLFQRYDQRAVNVCLEKLLCEASEKIAAARPETPVRESRSGGRGHSQSETHIDDAPTTNSTRPPAASLKQMADRQSAAMATKAATIVRLSKLDEVWINGRHLGDVTPREAMGWADKHEITSRFVRMVCAGVPQDDPIRKWIKPDDADELFRRAQENTP